MSKPFITARGVEWLRHNALLVAGLFLLLAGIAALLVGGSGPGGSESFGWFAYAPLPDDGDLLLWSTRSATLAVVGATSAAVGFAALAGSIGYRAGRRKTAEA